MGEKNAKSKGGKMESKIVENNQEILFIYDAKMCNPNGDPDNENKPRMDYDREMNLVSDLRLKRYIRDYIEQYKKEPIFVSEVDGKTVVPKDRLEALIKKESKKIDLTKIKEEDVKWLLDKLPDIRLFGAVIPDCKFEKGGNATFTGAVQFNWGYSLNKVSGPMESNGITSHFSTEAGRGPTMGKDYRVDYSLIAFHGIISAARANHTLLTEDDVNLLDEAMIKSIPLLTTRSKIGQYPRLYLRVEYNSSEFFIGDLRKYVRRLEDKPVRFVSDYKLNLEGLKKILGDNKNRIKKIHWWKHDDFDIEGMELNESDKLKF